MASDDTWLSGQFEEHRAHLEAVASRMLGSVTEAEDAVQETWVRLSRKDTSDVANLGGWLTTVVGRICLDMLRSRQSRREDPHDTLHVVADDDPEQQAVLADSVGAALIVVLDTLAPDERLAFVLHDLFAVPFDEIATILGRTPDATRQLASRARRRVQGREPGSLDDGRHEEIVRAFFAASREGNFDALVALLHPDVALRGGPKAAEGAVAVAGVFCGAAQTAELARVDGMPGALWALRGKVRAVWDFTIVDGRVAAIDQIMDPDRIAALEIEVLKV